MSRASNRLAEMEIFVQVVEYGGFSTAAREERMTPSAVSKLIGRLENRLGVRLFNRSTRKLQLTPEGLAFYERSIRILSDMEVAEHEASAAALPRGRLRVNCNLPFGMHFLLPALPEFLGRHPDVTIDIALTDAVIDLIEERTDIAIRVGPLSESSLIARKLGESRVRVVASPAYLEKHGRPRTIADLQTHNRLGFCFTRMVEGWPFRDEHGDTVVVPPIGNVLVSDGEAMRLLVLAGLGIGRLGAFHVDADIKAGRLVSLLDEFNPGDTEAINAIYVGQGGYLPVRVRAFLDFLAEKIRIVT